MTASNKSFLFVLLVLFISCDDKNSTLHKFINKELENGEVPGIGISIIIDGDIIMSKGFGYSDIENQVYI